MLSANEEELNELSKQDELVKKFDKKMFILNDDGTFTRTLTEEQDKELLFNTRVTLAKKEGIQQGEKIGMNRKMKQIAKSMLKENIPMKTIIKVTGLSKKEIEKIQK